MKAVMIYRPNSDQERPATEFRETFLRQTGHDIETADLNTRDGDALAALYDITAYPAILVLSDSGEMQQLWQGPEQMPRVDDVLGYLTA